jgi:hypothetical protein
MPEEQQFQGNRWTTQTKAILTELGWRQRATSNFDIPCYNKLLHKTGTNDRKNSHGIDLMFSFQNPYSKSEQTVIVESKNRKWNGINTSSIQEFVDQLLMTIECARLHSDFYNSENTDISTGLLMIWCNEPALFREETYRNYLKKLKVPSKKRPIEIFIASNTEILRWCSLIEKVKELKTKFKDFQFFYPGDHFSGGQTSPLRLNHITLSHLFSDYIFAKSKELITLGEHNIAINVHHVFFFAEPTLEELNFMYSCLSRYQFEDAEKLIIHLYGEQTKHRVAIDEFVRSKNESLKEQKSKLTISTDYMLKLTEVPENYSYERG